MVHSIQNPSGGSRDFSGVIVDSGAINFSPPSDGSYDYSEVAAETQGLLSHQGSDNVQVVGAERYEPQGTSESKNIHIKLKFSSLLIYSEHIMFVYNASWIPSHSSKASIRFIK